MRVTQQADRYWLERESKNRHARKAKFDEQIRKLDEQMQRIATRGATLYQKRQHIGCESIDHQIEVLRRHNADRIGFTKLDRLGDDYSLVIFKDGVWVHPPEEANHSQKESDHVEISRKPEPWDAEAAEGSHAEQS